MLAFRHATRAIKGSRSYQEDAAAVWPGAGDAVPKAPSEAVPDAIIVSVLADGMGGHAGGALASSTICTGFLAAFVDAAGSIEARLRIGLEVANAAIRKEVDANASLLGMGATLVGVAFGPEGARWISVGDSPFYLVRRNEIVRLNEDHSLAPILDQMVADGRMDAEDAKADPRRHYLRSAVTGEELELVDASRKALALEAGDVLVVASDGIHTLEDRVILSLVKAARSEGAEAIATALIRGVERGEDPYQDNTTVTVVVAEDAARS